jgi:site-specific recombinase XerD
MQFRASVDAFLRICSVERRFSSHTIQAYSYDLADFRKWLGSADALRDISTATLKDYLEEMVSQRKLAASTVRRRLACLRAFFRFVSDHGEGSNPFDGWRLKLPRKKQLPRSLSRKEAAVLLSALHAGENGEYNRAHKVFGITIRLMISTGLRVGEVCKLRREDVSSDGSIVRIAGKGSRERVAYVTDAKLSRELQRLATRRSPNGTVALFPNRDGSPMKPRSIRMKLRGLAKHEGLARRITPHMLRHTAATLLIESGVDIRFVQRLLGHSSIATTEIYTHVSDEALRTTLTRANVLGLIGV